MSCPYLAVITVSFCRAYPVKKLLPTDRIGGSSRCDGEAWGGCPAFREAATGTEGERLVESKSNEALEGGKS